ncbi:sulfur carrier protein ThiS [Pimelobacter sp. 30-1]|uniref:sulfur carrier protein ThiS n=1 Tax=Pimelobacter sp. 30-1 TaxID=2004991 RepID=UPI001C04559E|nr:sulfur carrier protein ThiS [Pimelobacter sp. 30-1]MBU2694571.1 thiamine biosynthesis protein ThiS [Pimelobacter sp. 30-1]
MTITCNGEPVRTEARAIADLLHERLGDPRPHGVAVAVNDEVVPRGEWAARRLVDGDVVEVVTAVQGG